MRSTHPLVILGSLAAIGAASASVAQSSPGQPVDRPAVQSPTTASGPARTDSAAQNRRTDANASPDSGQTAQPQRRTWFSLRPYAPDAEPWDPAWQMDPRIGRHQRWNAPN